MATALSQSQFISAIADMGTDYSALILGAGASRSSGVLLAREIVHDIVASEYCHANGIADDLRRRVPASEVRGWLELQDWYRGARARGESDYSAVFRQFKPTRDHQLKYIASLLVGAAPSRAYHALCHLVRRRIFPVVLTTNFDPLLENCYKGKFLSESSLRTIESPTMFSQVTLEANRTLLAHLHGNLNGYDIANLDESTHLLKKDIESAVKRLVNPYALAVMGYSGSDNSVMSLLEQLVADDPSSFRRGVIYWCHTPGGALSPRVTALLDSVSQGFTVQIAGFDQTIQALSERLQCGNHEFKTLRPPELEEEGEAGEGEAAINVALLEALPQKLHRFRTGLRWKSEIAGFATENDWWQATIYEGELWMIGDPAELPFALRQKISATPVDIELNDKSLSDSLTWRIFTELVNKGLKCTLRREHGLREFRGNRFFFPKPKNADERTLKYMSRKRKAWRRVVWLEFSRGDESSKTEYFCHESIRASVMRFRGQPSLALSPTRLFTIAGDDVWDSPTARTSIGRSTGKVWNESYDSLVRLWLDVLSKGSDTVNVRFSADGRKPEYRLQFANRPLVAREIERS